MWLRKAVKAMGWRWFMHGDEKVVWILVIGF